MAPKTAIYARISDDRDGTGLGVERQEIDCRRLAEERGLGDVPIFTDNDIKEGDQLEFFEVKEVARTL